MSVVELLDTLAKQGVELWFEGERLRFRAPAGALTADQRAQLSARRIEVVAQLRANAGAARDFPLSFSQQSLWFVNQESPESAAYNVAFQARVVSTVDVVALRQALQAVLDRHATLRTTYPAIDGSPVQRVAGTGVVAFAIHNADGLDDDTLHERVRADYRRPFDLEAGPVFRATLFSRSPVDHVFMLAAHHIAADGWSLLQLLEELRALYAEATGRVAVPLPRAEVQYSDFTTWQAAVLVGPEAERLTQYWRQQLGGAVTNVEIPSDRPRPARKSSNGASLSFDLGERLSTALRQLARNEGATPFVVLLAAFKTLLFQYTGSEDLIVGTPTFGRNRPEFAQVVGNFVNTIPLRSRVDASLSFRDLVGRMKQTVFDALDAQDFPLPLIVERVRPVRDPGRSPLFDILFVFQRFDMVKGLEPIMTPGGATGTIDFAGLRLEYYPLEQQEGQFDLTLEILDGVRALSGRFKYNADLFDRGTVRRMSDHFRALLEGIVADPAQSLGALPLPMAGSVPKRESVAALLDRLRAADIRLFLEGDRLRSSAPKGAMTDTLRAVVAARKEEIIAALQGSPDVRKDGAEHGAIRRIPRDRPLPVSSVQQRFWFADRMRPGDASYNVGGAFRIRGYLDADILRYAIDELVRRHESLRSRIRERDGVPELEIADSAGASLEEVDVSHLSPEARDRESRQLLAERLRTPFDLANGPLSGYQLVRLAPDEHTLALTIHHIVADGWSMHIATREIFATYEALTAGRAPTLTPLRVQYVDYAAWEQEQLQSGQMRQHLNYWKQELAGAPSLLELPTDRPRPAVRSSRGHRVTLDLDTALLEPLKQLSRQYDATLFMTLVAAFQVLLHRYSGQDDIVIGSPMANRVRPELEGIIGCFVNNLILRGRVSGNPTFVEFLGRSRHATLGAFDHRDLPFDLIVDGLRPDRGASQAPIFQVLLTLHSFPIHVTPPHGLTFEIIEGLQTGAARFDLALDVVEYDGRFSATYEYASDLFDNETIVRMHAHFGALLRAAVADPTCRVEELPLLDAADERLLLGKWSDTSVEHDRGRCVHQLLDAVARATPEAIAVRAGRSVLTYRELDERANRLARRLIQRKVELRSLVAVCLDRTVDMPVALAAVLKAGAAYVPLDPTHPMDRLRQTLEDAAVSCVMTVSRFAPLFAGVDAPLVLLDEASAELEKLPTNAPAVTVTPEDRAYVIYTSGSTGRPKGVEVEHRNVVAFLEAMRGNPGYTSRDVLLAVTTLSFDIAGLEFWLPLTTGGCVVIASRNDVLDGERLIGLIEEHGVTVMQATPATWRLMLDAGWTGKRDLRALCGGEALPRDLAALLTERVGELWNMYGPTETTIWSTTSRIQDANAPITIGRPIDNTRIYVLEPSGHLAPIGVVGELCIGGEGVARGYHNRPELTAEKFVNITLPNGRVERVYRTGDMARFRSDGQVEFFGRRDQQVKVRGYRIELGEIESALSAQPGVKACAVAVREDAPGDRRIAAYVVEAEGAVFDPEAARTALRGRLPEYMIPSLFTVLPTLPLTPNGKIDRKALPAPQALTQPIAEVVEALMTPAQRRVAAAWREVLRADQVGLHDNFFDVGGHSLLLVKLHAVLKREFGGTLELVELFQWTTVAAQATRLSAVAAPDGALRRAQSRAARQI